MPLTGSITVGCTWDSGCPSGYHGSGAKALDFLVPVGRPVYASGPGVITQAVAGCGANSNGCNGGRGNFIQVSHGSFSSRYLHLSQIVKASGDVTPGTLIGYSGNSGQNAADHLHYDELTDPNNGLGKLDPGVLYACHGAVKVSYPSAAGYASWSQVPYNTVIHNDGYNCGATASDMDGDSLADTADQCPYFVGASNTAGCPAEDFDTSFRGDFNGDGRSDIAAFYDYGSAHAKGLVFTGSATGLSNGSAQFWDSGVGNFELNRTRLVGGDFNGDGKSESPRSTTTAAPTPRDSSSPAQPPACPTAAPQFWDSGVGNFELNRTRLVGGDFNGDGKSDIAAFYDYGSAHAKGLVFTGSATGLSNGSAQFWDSGVGNFELEPDPPGRR